MGFLLQKFCLVSALIVACCSVLSAPLLIDRWQTYRESLDLSAQIDLFEAGLNAVRAIATERGPTNGRLDAGESDAAEWAARLQAARETSDRTLLRFRTLLTGSVALPLPQIGARVDAAVETLAARRGVIDALVALPRAQRTPADLAASVDGMMELTTPLMAANLQIGADLSKRHKVLADEILIALLGADLRDFAGQLGSQMVIALFQGTRIAPARVSVTDRIEGRISHLQLLLDARLMNDPADTELTAARTTLQERYFRTGLAFLKETRAAEIAAPGTSGVHPGSLTERYVPEMRSIEAIRDLAMLRARAIAETQRIAAFAWLIANGVTVAAIFGLLAAAGFLVHRQVVRPLIATTREIEDLAAERFTVPHHEDRYSGEIGDMVRAIAVLRVKSLRRRQLEREREALLREVKALAETDHLTGLSNRRTFDILGSSAVERGEAMAVVLCDIDHFKAINDRFGHSCGDAVIQEVARRLQETVREADTVFRYGGEEFAVILRTDDRHLVPRIAERLRTSIARAPIAAGAHRLAVTISAGVVWQPGGGPATDLATVVDRADTALYRAKQSGRNRVETAAVGHVPAMG